ncbi:MAG TPA: hypothetical protein PKK10_06845 [Woeseiaceae bacterium]|nr:hypothetical protein [Woeseiaceae bacterium]
MQFSEFVRSYRDGTIRTSINSRRALRVCETDLRIPGAMRVSLKFWHTLETALLTGGVLALLFVPWHYAAAAILVGALLKPGTRASAKSYVLNLALQDEGFYNDMHAALILQLRTPGTMTNLAATQAPFRPRSIL